MAINKELFKEWSHGIYECEFNDEAETITLKPDKETPLIIIDEKKHSIQFEEKSSPPDPDALFKPIFLWIEDLPILEEERVLSFNFRFRYYNATTFKRISRLLSLAQEIENKKFMPVYNWYCIHDDDKAISDGLYFKELFEDNEINIIRINDENL